MESNYQYPVGSRVMVKPSAREDVAGVAWPYLQYKTGVVRYVDVNPVKGQPGAWSVLYCVEFDDEFRGGWDAFGNCAPGRGQQVSQQHLELVEYVDHGKAEPASPNG